MSLPHDPYPYRTLTPALSAMLKELEFGWAGDLLRLRSVTIGHVAPYQLQKLDEQGDPIEDEFIEMWRVHNEHGQKLGNFHANRDEAIVAAEVWAANKHALLMKLMNEIVTLRHQVQQLQRDNIGNFRVG